MTSEEMYMFVVLIKKFFLFLLRFLEDFALANHSKKLRSKLSDMLWLTDSTELSVHTLSDKFLAVFDR